MSLSVLARARAGEEDAFRELTDPHRRELQLHCYRMLGSVHDAEDALQETLVSAWRGLGRFEERASLRAWLYRIATNRCLNYLRQRRRRPQRHEPLPFEPPEATRLEEVTWLEPYPDEWLDELPAGTPGPDSRYETREAVALAFITALQRLPARQRAALVLRDVLGFTAEEAAEVLETTEATVNSALQRARSALDARMPPRPERVPLPGSKREREVAERFATAFERGEIDRVVALLTDDAWVTMPPEPFEYQGRERIAEFLSHAGAAVRRPREVRLVATRANGHPAFGHYLREAGEPHGRLSGLLVVVLEGERIARITRFGESLLPPAIPLPATLTW